MSSPWALFFGKIATSSVPWECTFSKPVPQYPMKVESFVPGKDAQMHATDCKGVVLLPEPTRFMILSSMILSFLPLPRISKPAAECPHPCDQIRPNQTTFFAAPQPIDKGNRQRTGVPEAANRFRLIAHRRFRPSVPPHPVQGHFRCFYRNARFVRAMGRNGETPTT
jgi:hypothetical protein